MPQVKGFTIDGEEYRKFKRESKHAFYVAYYYDGASTFVPKGFETDRQSGRTSSSELIEVGDAVTINEPFVCAVFHFPNYQNRFHDFVRSIVRSYNENNNTRYRIGDISRLACSPVLENEPGISEPFLMLDVTPEFSQYAQNASDEDAEYLEVKNAFTLPDGLYQPSPPAKPDDL